MVIVYDEELNQGVTGVNCGGSVGLWNLMMLKITDDANNTMDFEIFAWNVLDPTVGFPDLIFRL